MKITHVIGDHVVNRFDNSISVTLRFSERCNYTCEYCHYHDNSIPFYDHQHHIQLIDNLFTILKNKSKIFVYLHGGEPTIIPHFEKLIDHILSYDNVHEIIIQTNCSKNIDWFKQFIGYEKITFAISYQHHMNRSKPFQHFKEKALFLFENNLLYQINFSLENMFVDEIISIIKNLNEFDGYLIYNYINTNPELYKEVHDIIEKTHFEDKEYAVKLTFDNNEVITYDNYNNIRVDGHDKFKNYTCTAGNKNLVIQPNGDVYYCLSHEHAGNPICNMIDDPETLNVVVNRNIILCNFNKCVCELWLEKKKLGY